MIRVYKYIWVWQTKEYIATGHIVVSDGSCAPFRRRVDKYVGIAAKPGEIIWIPNGYAVGGSSE